MPEGCTATCKVRVRSAGQCGEEESRGADSSLKQAGDSGHQAPDPRRDLRGAGGARGGGALPVTGLGPSALSALRRPLLSGPRVQAGSGAVSGRLGAGWCGKAGVTGRTCRGEGEPLAPGEELPPPAPQGWNELGQPSAQLPLRSHSHSSPFVLSHTRFF